MVEAKGNMPLFQAQEQAEYARIVRLVASDQQLRLMEQDYFSPKDRLGRTAFRLLMEARAIKEDPEEIFPAEVATGFICTAHALTALWFYLAGHQEGGKHQVVKVSKLLLTEERTNISNFITLCHDTVRGRLPKDDRGLRVYVGMIKSSAQEALSDQSKDVQNNFNRGVDIAFSRWRELSSNA